MPTKSELEMENQLLMERIQKLEKNVDLTNQELTLTIIKMMMEEQRQARDENRQFIAEVNKEINKIERMKVKSKVGDKAVDWCHSLVVVPKPCRKVRICVDLKKLNDQVKKSIHHPMRTPWDIILSIPTKIEFFTTLDAKQGYWQMELEEKSREMTCSMTP
nr:uncharacterized protein LOC121128855 [Lepeophtheirus salmonis]